MMKRFLPVLALLICLPVFGQKKAADPRASYAHVFEYQVNGKAQSCGVNMDNEQLTLQLFAPKGKKWKVAGEAANYSLEHMDGATTYASDSLAFVELEGGKYCLFSYLNSYEEGKQLEYHISMMNIADGTVETVSFSGKNLLSSSKLPDFKIEGFSNLSIIDNTPVVKYMADILSADSRFVEIPEDIYLTDKSIEWWLENNPKALTSAKFVNIGTIPAESSIVAKFKTLKKEKNSRFEAAVMDLRGYTLVVAKNLSTGSYILVWAEPECKNRKTDRFLRNVYFENENTLAMFYYKGSSTFKYRINLASRDLKR